jgi:hypothetical protein
VSWLYDVVTAGLALGLAVTALYRNKKSTGRTYYQLMANFHAKDYGTVQYNFHPDAPEVRGVIPDPSDDMLQAYHKAIREVMKESGIEDLPTESEIRANPGRLDDMMDRVEAFDQIETHHRILDIIATLCQNQPSVEDMMKLPYRKRIRFVRFVQKELTNPEA